MNQNLENLNKNDLIKEFKKDIDFLKNQVEKKENGETLSIDVESYEQGLYEGISWLENNIKDSNDKIKFLEIKGVLLDKNKQISSEQLRWLWEIFIKLEQTDLEQNDLDNLRNSIETLRKSKSKLNALRQSVSWNLTPEQEKIKEVKEKVKKYKDKLIDFSTEHSIWTKALILLLPAKLAVLFKPKEKTQSDTTENNWALWWALGQIKDLFWKMEWFAAQIATVFFSWFAPKEMIKLLAEIKSDFADVDPKLLDKFKWEFSSVTEKFKNYSPEKLKDSVELIENRLRTIIPKAVKKINWKDIPEDKLNDIIDKINVKEFFKNDTQEMEKLVKYFKDGEENGANYVKAWFEWITLPFKLFIRIFSVLKKEDCISYTDLWVHFLKKTWEIFMGTFWLMGSGVSYLTWKIDGKNFEQSLKDVFAESPDEAKEIFAIMLYRHWWLVFSTLWAISNYVWKYVIYTSSGETSFTKTILSWLRWNVDEYVRVLKKFSNIADFWELKSLSQLVEKILNELDEANNIVKLLWENKGISGNKFIKMYEKKFWKKPTILWDIKGLTYDKLQSEIASKISNIWGWLDRDISALKSMWWKYFKWINSSSYLLDDLSKNIKHTSSYLSNVVKNDNIFNKARSQLKKLWLTKNMMEIDPLYDKLVFKFNSPENAKDFFSNLAKLSKQSPELLNFIFDKTPLFLVAWLSAAKGDTLKEFWEQLLYLVPFFGSWYMLVDAMDAGKENLAQAWISTILLWTETWYATYQLVTNWKEWAKNVLRYIFKPWRDIVEIAWFLSKTWVTTLRLWQDAFKLMKAWKLNFDDFKKVFEKFPKLKAKWKVWFLLLAVFLWYEYVFADESEIEGFVKDCKKDWKVDWKVDISCMDKEIKKQWKDLSNDEKAKFIAMSYWIRTWKVDGIEWKYEDGKYKIVLNEQYWSIPNKYRKDEIVSMIKTILQKYGETNLDVEVYFKRSLLDEVFAKNKLSYTKEKEQYLQALWYNENMIEKVLK